MRFPILLLLAMSAAAGETPIISLTCPDLGRSGQRLAAGPYGAIWRLPQVQQLRRELAELPGTDPLWMGLIERAEEVRLSLSMQPAAGGAEASPRPCLAVRMPPGRDPAAPTGAKAVRAGAWWMIGDETADPALPAATPGDAAADLRVVIDLPALKPVLPAEAIAAYEGVLRILGLGRITAAAWANDQGMREEIRAPGAKLPLRELDPAALAGFPVTSIGIGAVGIDGEALDRQFRGIVLATAGPRDLARLEERLLQSTGLTLDRVLRACDGTIVLATTPGMPFPGMTLSLPASPDMDALVAFLLAQLDPELGARVVADARNGAVLLPTPRGTPIPFSLRRTSGRWIISSDQALLQELAQATPAAFPYATTWPHGQGAVAVAWGDTRAQVQMLASVLPMALMQIKDAGMRQRLGRVQQALFAILPHLQPSVLVARQDGGGLRIDGENGLVTDIMPLSILAGMALPAISMVRQSAQRTVAGNNMRMITISCIAYCQDYDGVWPNDLAEVRKWADGDLVDKVFICPGHPEIAQPYLYVRPDPRAKAIQPILVQDPACNRGKGSMVCYGDGHVAFVAGTDLWTEAQRLAALPKAATREQGVTMDDWSVDTVTGKPRQAAGANGGGQPGF